MLSIINSIQEKSEQETIQAISKALDGGADINEKCKIRGVLNLEYENTIMDAAVEAVKPKVVNFILRRHPKISPSIAGTLFHRANLKNEEDICKIVGDLSIARVEFKESWRKILPSCVSKGLTLVVKELLNYITPKNHETLSFSFSVAIGRNSVEMCNLFLDAGACIDDDKVVKGEDDHRLLPPLFLACSMRRLQVVELLLKRGAQLASRDKHYHALQYAASSGSVECVKMILAAVVQAQEEKEPKTYEYFTDALDECVRKRRYGCFEHLLDFIVALDPEKACIFDEDLILEAEHDGYHFLQIVLAAGLPVYCDDRHVENLICSDVVDVVEILLTHPNVDIIVGKNVLNLWIEKLAPSERMKEILRARIENSGEDGILIPTAEIKREVKQEAEEETESAGSRRQRNNENQEKKKPKNSAVVSKK